MEDKSAGVGELAAARISVDVIFLHALSGDDASEFSVLEQQKIVAEKDLAVTKHTEKV